jgi:hypothetical protein
MHYPRSFASTRRPSPNEQAVFVCNGRGTYQVMLLDILVAVIIVAIAAVLGLVVHPVLWVIVIAAALWLFARRGTRHARY